MTTLDGIVEARAVSPKTSARKAELIALPRALELSKGRKVNIWTESKYPFGVVHAHGAIWKERRLLSAQGTEIKRAAQIQELLQCRVQRSEDLAMSRKVRG